MAFLLRKISVLLNVILIKILIKIYLDQVSLSLSETLLV